MELGQRLKDLRSKNNITQEEFADRLYVSSHKSTYINYH